MYSRCSTFEDSNYYSIVRVFKSVTLDFQLSESLALNLLKHFCYWISVSDILSYWLLFTCFIFLSYWLMLHWLTFWRQWLVVYCTTSFFIFFLFSKSVSAILTLGFFKAVTFIIVFDFRKSLTDSLVVEIWKSDGLLMFNFRSWRLVVLSQLLFTSYHLWKSLAVLHDYRKAITDCLTLLNLWLVLYCSSSFLKS